MTERFIAAAVIVACVALLGWILRAGVRARTQRRSANIMLPAAGTPRLLVFSTRFCADCATQKHIIEEARATWSQPVDVQYRDAVIDGELAGKLGILTVPALVFAGAEGRIIDVAQGLVDGDRLRSLIEAAA
jgi:thioredoxin-like negative regulator of GroEL